MKSLNIFLFITISLAALLWISYFHTDVDLWGHLKYGLDTLARGSLLEQDIYSYSAAGASWTNHEWLSELIYALIYKMLGMPGLILLKLSINLLAIFFISQLICRQTKYIFERSILFISVVSLFTIYFSALRPQLFSYLFAAIYIYFFYEITAAGKSSKAQLVIFPLVMACWVNLHGGFLAGLGLFFLFTAAYAIDTKRFPRGLVVSLIVTAAATLLNPYCWKLHLFLYQSLSIPRNIIEWGILPPDSICEWIFVGFSLLVLILSTKKKTAVAVTFILVTGYLGIKHIKLFPFFLLANALILPCFFEDLLRRQLRLLRPPSARLSRRKQIVILCCLLLLSLFSGIRIIRQIFNPDTGKKDRFPVMAVNYLKNNNLSGNILCYYNFSQYCIWQLYPQFRVFYDGRFRTVYPPEIEKAYFDFHCLRDDWQKALQSYPTEFVLWPHNEPVIKLLEEDENWQDIYRDEKIVILRKKNG